MGFNPFKKGDWEKLGGQAKDEFEKVEKALNDVGDQIERDLKKAGLDAKSELIRAGKQARRELKDGVEKELPALLQKALAEIEQAITKEGLKKIRDGIRSADHEIEGLRKRKPQLAGALDIPGGSITLGPMTLKYSGFFTRTATLADTLDGTT